MTKLGEMDLGSATNIFFAMETDSSQPMLELTHNHDRTEPYDKGDGYAHVAFTVKGLEEKVERLKGEGVKVTLEPKAVTADGNDYRIAFIEDPDSYKIELVERGTMKVGEITSRGKTGILEKGGQPVGTARTDAVEVVPEDYSYVFNPYREPIARVGPGQRVKIHTEDAFESRIHTPEDLPSRALATAKFLNPQTGPIYVEGAEPGDTLAVRMENIEPKRDYAVSCFVPFFGGLTSTTLTRTLQEPLPEKVYVWNLSEDDGGRYLVNDEIGVRLPWDPFVGTIAVAPDLEAISALSPGPFGGNMDVPDVKPGNTVYLPVWNDGALFYTGDCHARQGQGELCGVALEITAEVTVSFEVIKGGGIEWPRIESEERLMTVGSARPMEDAARIAYAELIGWLADEHGFSQLDAYQLLTQAGGLYVGNMVDTTYSLVASVEKRFLARG